MSIYVIGDVQGCFDELQALLAEIRFQAGEDRLWLVGDLVNRGPRSVDVVRLIMELGDDAITVLGNHELHLLATAAGARNHRKKDTFDDILAAPDRDDLLAWLATRSMIHHDAELGFVMVHAGVHPDWDASQGLALGREVEEVLRGSQRDEFLSHMYGDGPERWSVSLTGWERLRFIVNALTRMRYVDERGALDLEHTGAPGTQPKHLIPWYAAPWRRSRSDRIVFGHWATLRLEAAPDPAHRVFHLDTGCVWGGELTAMRLEDGRYFSVRSSTTKL